MRRHEQVLAATHTMRGERALVGARRGLAAKRDVDHHVADDVHIAGDRLGAQVCRGRVGGAQQQRREVVGEHAVELLGHAPVERAHAGLDVHDRRGGLRCSERAGERRVGVAVYEHRVRCQLGDQRLERAEHACRLPGVRAAADAQLAVGPRQSQLGEEHTRERVVVVLAGVHEHLLVALAQRPRHGRCLDELRPVADDCEDLHARSLCVRAILN